MKKKSLWLVITSISVMLLSGCDKKNSDTWDDNSTSMGSYRRAGQRVLWGQDSNSEIVVSEDVSTSFDEDFIPLKDEDLKQHFSDLAIAQPKQSPGEEGSFLPGIDGFKIPTSALSAVFRTIHFGTDEHVIKNQDDMQTLSKVASYLKNHPKTYIFISGHCDQRGPEAYNLALGTRRANSVRAMLVQKGVSPEQIHTVSFGKEHLLDKSNTPMAWSKNRRAEFKIYEQK
jgi:peptidoglycan-associated lipoprotein